MVRTRLGSVPTTPLPSGGVADGAAASLGGNTAPAGLSLISTGCSSRDTSFSPCPRSLTRSVISLLGGASLLLAGTTLLGVESALITGGGALEPDEPNSAR